MSKKIMVVCCVVGLIVSAVSVVVTDSGFFRLLCGDSFVIIKFKIWER